MEWCNMLWGGERDVEIRLVEVTSPRISACNMCRVSLDVADGVEERDVTE